MAYLQAGNRNVFTNAVSLLMKELDKMLREMGVLKANHQRVIAGAVLFLLVSGLGMLLLERDTTARSSCLSEQSSFAKAREDTSFSFRCAAGERWWRPRGSNP